MINRLVKYALAAFVLLLAVLMFHPARAAVVMSLTAGTETIYLHDQVGNCPKVGTAQSKVAEYRDTADGERQFGCYLVTVDGERVLVRFPQGSYANVLLELHRRNFKPAI